MRIKESNDSFEITFEYNRRLTWAIKKLMEVCPGAEYEPRRKSFFFPKIYAPQVYMFGQKYGFVFTKEHAKADWKIPELPELTQDSL